MDFNGGEAPVTEEGGEGGAVGGAEEVAVGGAVGPAPASGTTVEDFLGMKGVDQMFTVTPLPWCPHLSSVVPPPRPLDVRAPCEQCGDCSENWTCLTCYAVLCSRFKQEHMLFHSVESGHVMTLSFSDLSVWCYACDSYVHNEALTPAKASAYQSKFGEPMAGI